MNQERLMSIAQGTLLFAVVCMAALPGEAKEASPMAPIQQYLMGRKAEIALALQHGRPPSA